MRNVGCLFLLSLVCLFACKDETRENPPLKGDAFWLANPWKFYFVDAEGKSVLRLKAGAAPDGNGGPRRPRSDSDGFCS